MTDQYFGSRYSGFASVSMEQFKAWLEGQGVTICTLEDCPSDGNVIEYAEFFNPNTTDTEPRRIRLQKLSDKDTVDPQMIMSVCTQLGLDWNSFRTPDFSF